jgi:hypothetical protein
VPVVDERPPDGRVLVGAQFDGLLGHTPAENRGDHVRLSGAVTAGLFDGLFRGEEDCFFYFLLRFFFIFIFSIINGMGLSDQFGNGPCQKLGVPGPVRGVWPMATKGVVELSYKWAKISGFVRLFENFFKYFCEKMVNLIKKDF